MAIILEFKDYADVHEALDMVNEGVLGNMWNKIKDAFRGISGKVDEAIATAEVEKMFDQRTGELIPPILDAINGIKDAASTKQAFAEMRAYVSEGWYFQQRMKFLEDGMVTLMDQASATKVGGEQAGKTAAQKAQAQGTKSTEAAAMEGEAGKQMAARIKDFDTVYRKAVANLETQVKAKMAALTKTASSDKIKLLINNRYSTCVTVLLLIEYDMKKLRLGAEQLDGLKNEMVNAYKTSLDSAKKLQIAMTQEKAPKMTPEAYEGLDINGFIKEYPPESVPRGEDGKVVENTPDKEFFVYPYEGRHIVITAYDVNAKTVTYKVVDNNAVTDEGDTVPFDQFKDAFLAGSEGQPPMKQKGGITEAPAAEQAAPAAAAPGPVITPGAAPAPTPVP